MNVEAVISQDEQSPNWKRDAPKGLKMGYSFYVYVYIHHTYIYIRLCIFLYHIIIYIVVFVYVSIIYIYIIQYIYIDTHFLYTRHSKINCEVRLVQIEASETRGPCASAMSTHCCSSRLPVAFLTCLTEKQR